MITEIEYPDCRKLFEYVDYILKVNGNKTKCYKMKVTFYKMLTYLNFHVVFYDNQNAIVASIQSIFLGGNEENYRYVLNYKNGQNYNTNYSKSQNILKESILKKLNLIKNDLLKKYF
jgi:hypothetical protein